MKYAYFKTVEVIALKRIFDLIGKAQKLCVFLKDSFEIFSNKFSAFLNNFYGVFFVLFAAMFHYLNKFINNF